MTLLRLRAITTRAAYVLILLASACRWASAAPYGTIRYEVSVANLAERKFRVAITVSAKEENREPGKDKSLVTLSIPAWSPGYYQILNFQKTISNFQAMDGKGKTLTVTKPDEFSWAILGGGETVYASYEVTAKDPGYGFFGSHLDDKTGYINGASALMYVVNGKQLPTTITYHVPKGWSLSSSLDPDDKADPDARDTSFKAMDYDELIDCPVQMGEFERIDFKVRDTPYAAILVGAGKVERERLVHVLTKVGEAGQAIFGYAPFKRYHFIYHFAIGNFGGGLEHRNSTVLNVWKGVVEDPEHAVDLIAHEYFHAWNVKRLHPAVLGPFDYSQKVRTNALWFCEGVTDYYAVVLPRMAGLSTSTAFLDELAGRIKQLQNTKARLEISAEEASRKAWEGGSMGFGGLSYYLKGSLLGLLLDVKVRAATNNAKSLDDVMRLLDQKYGQKNVGYPEEGLLQAVNAISGQDMSDFFKRYVAGTEEIPWNSILKDAGLIYEDGILKNPYLGVGTSVEKGQLVLSNVQEDSAAEKAGLRTGDRLVTLNNKRIVPNEFSNMVGKLRVGQHITIGIRRGKMAMDIELNVGEKENPYTRLRMLSGIDDRAKHVRDGLLREGVVAASTSSTNGSGAVGGGR